MRRVLVLALLAVAPGCRRSPPVEPAVAPGIAPSAAAAPTPAAQPVTADRPEAAPAPPAPETAAAPPAEAASPPAAPAEAAPPEPANDPEDDRIYTWTDERGTIHYGTASEAPPETRRAVGGQVTVVPSRSFDVPPTIDAPPPPGSTAAPEPEPPARGPRPQLDAEGLPVPGTMDDTAHTDAVRRAAGVQLDPASVERQRALENRRMNCVEKDGATVCSGE